MKRDIKSDFKYKVKVQVAPNYGLVYMLDRDLQKQLDDLNEMKRPNYSISKLGKKAV